jgi:hypothetical protein
MPGEGGKQLPHGWVAGNDEMGCPSDFRRKLRGRVEHYLLGVPSNTLARDLEVPPPACAGRGRHPMNPFSRLDRWLSALPKEAWTTIDVREGEKGPLAIAAVSRRGRRRGAPGRRGCRS